jgi:DNA-binding NarL/FixJ family response regulator
MSGKTLFSLIESPAHPKFSGLYQRLGLNEIRLNSSRKAMSELKKNPPDYVVAEFFYGYGNNYAGINISNLDVFLHALRRYAPQAKVIVLVEKPERQYVDKLMALFEIHATLVYPVSEKDMEAVLS